MKREFIVARIEASQDGSPYVYVTFNDPKDYKPDRPTNPFGQNTMAFSSIEDMMKNMPKVIANMPGMFGGGLTDTPIMKMSMKEYQDMGIKVGEKVTIEIQKIESSGI
ncbi:hypothetical protein NTE_02002 [Candidatus Nitrososphaera evergladensis SR1]|jgi:hypothetical protein|uniref:Arcadin 1 domain-containing protein n=1 Tax=Candidatus Nitrososphaera evergladensis SR1 TaxID=1459636 RepID=A0A075MXN3_9ARCH|nr:hypothetical protein [Candidatus Nitrososphaera evergladensis]AIF84059.1 hypothetical protein NTE_02002 [Candidatus Nitrososphaera evergladensis SR1]